MAYVKFHADWRNRVQDLTTPISAEALEHIEQGIFDAAADADAANAAVAGKADAAAPGQAVATHNAETAGVHGIANTALLETQAGAQTKADEAKDRANHTGVQDADTIIDGVNNHVFTAADDTKLATVNANATQNETDAFLLDRANHSGTQDMDTLVETAGSKIMTSDERAKLTDLPVETFTWRAYDGAVYPNRGVVGPEVKVIWYNDIDTTQPSIGGVGAQDGDITLIVAS